MKKKKTNTRAPLTEDQVAQMYRFYQAGIPLENIGLAFGGRNEGTVWDLFKSRGLEVRPRGQMLRERRNERQAADAFFEMAGAAEQLGDSMGRAQA